MIQPIFLPLPSTELEAKAMLLGYGLGIVVVVGYVLWHRLRHGCWW